MMKALYFQFTVGVAPMYAVTFIGYWAYGTEASAYLLNNVSGPVWVKAAANISAFLQTVISLHVIAIPTTLFFFSFHKSFLDLTLRRAILQTNRVFFFWDH